MDLPKKVVWITGASSGIGEALAYEFNQKGAYVILSARRIEELERVKSNCENNEETVRILSLDLTKQTTFTQKVEEALEQFGTIDMLINNGGISQRSTVLETNMETIRKIMEINFFGTVALTKELLPTFKEQKSGHIVVTSSVAGKFGTKQRSAYAASKHALHGWFDSLRLEVQDDNIDVTLVCPGFIKTDISKNALTANGSAHNKMDDGQKKGMSPDEFAKRLLPKLAKKKMEVYIGGTEILAIYIKRLSLRLLTKILSKTKNT